MPAAACDQPRALQCFTLLSRRSQTKADRLHAFLCPNKLSSPTAILHRQDTNTGHFRRRWGGLERLGRRWDGIWDGLKCEKPNVYRPWDGGTAYTGGIWVCPPVSMQSVFLDTAVIAKTIYLEIFPSRLTCLPKSQIKNQKAKRGVGPNEAWVRNEAWGQIETFDISQSRRSIPLINPAATKPAGHALILHLLSSVLRPLTSVLTNCLAPRHF